MARKRVFNTFNLSFLDIMSCGFGAVILVFLIIDHSIEEQSRQLNKDLRTEVAELTKKEEIVSELRKKITSLENNIETNKSTVSDIEDKIQKENQKLEDLKDEIEAEKNKNTQPIDNTEEPPASESGSSPPTLPRDDNIQLLTGLNLSGSRILILLDASASMLAEKIEDIYQLKISDDDEKKAAEKWRRAVDTAHWLASNLPPNAEYQIATFNTVVKFSLPRTANKWLSVSDSKELREAKVALDDVIPSGGTNLYTTFSSISKMPYLPDNIILITDGLPTQGASKSKAGVTSQNDRVELFKKAKRELPENVPVNIILFYLEGDAQAAYEFWGLAREKGGTFIGLAKDALQ